MKGLSIKKVAAVAAGAALVGTAFAPIVSAQLDLQKSDVFNDNGTPKVKIVVGSDSAPSDGVWAGNIAAAIAEQARVYKSVSVSGSAGAGGSTASVTDLSAKLVIGGSQTFENAKVYKAGETSGTTDMNSGIDVGSVPEFGPVVLTNSVLTNLINKQEQIKWNGSDYTRTFKEEVGIEADALFDYQGKKGAADLELLVKGTDDINYSVNLGSGIPWYESTTSATKFTDASNDNIKIPFFGERYLVREANKTGGDSGFLRLIKEQDKLSFVEGDLITGLKGKNTLAGQDVSVKVQEIIAAGPAAASYSAKFVLIDAEGNEVDVYTATTGESLNEQFSGSDGEVALETIVYVDTIGVGAASGVGTVDVTLGTTLVDLYASRGYPYDSTITGGNYDYRVSFENSSDGNYLTRITIGNQKVLWTNNSGDLDPLYPSNPGQALTTAGEAGESEIKFLHTASEDTLGYNFFSIEFQGFESDEPVATTKFTSTGIQYRDASDRQHTIPYYLSLNKSATNQTKTFDGKTFYYNSNYAADTTYFDLNSSQCGRVNGVCTTIDLNGDSGAEIAANAVDINFGNGWNNHMILNAGLDINGFYPIIVDTNTTVAATENNDTIRLGFDGNITFATATINSSLVASDYLLSSWTGPDGNTHRDLYFADANTSDRQAYTGRFIALKGVDDVTYNYALYSDHFGSSGLLYLLLAGRANSLSGTLFDGRYDVDFYLYGTDLGEDSVVDANINPHGIQDAGGLVVTLPVANGADRGYYWLDHSDFGEGVSAETYYISHWSIETGGNTTTAAETSADYDTNFYLDTSTHAGPQFPNTNLSGYSSDINFNGNRKDGHLFFGMDTDPLTTAQPSIAYNDTGGKMQVTDSEEIIFTVPDSATRALLVVKTEGTTTTTTGGEELIIAEGESGTTEAGTTIMVDEITYSASCTAGTGGDESCVATPENYFEPAAVPEQMVFLDSEAPSGALVLVGGHLVNRLSAQISNIRDVLTSSGDGRTPWRDEDTGNWVVAGYTAQDTVSSAKAFIDAVEAIDMMG